MKPRETVKAKSKLELIWVGKEERKRLEPRVLVEDSALSYGDPYSQNLLINGDNLLAFEGAMAGLRGQNEVHLHRPALQHW